VRPSPPGPFGPSVHRPVIIAHGAGNSPTAASSAIDEGADLLEVDLWLHRDRLEARHERRLSFLPLLYETWYLKRPSSPHFGLPELIDLATRSNTGILLDLKGGNGAPPVLRQLLAGRADLPPIIVSSQSWACLRALHAEMPALRLLYSIDVSAGLDLFLAVAERDPLPRGVSCRHSLLTPAIVERLRRAGLLVVAWTVDDPARARELAAWGVDGITTHRVAHLREALRTTP
jgi:glycerophosphoryl diester phosphodiesterase